MHAKEKWIDGNVAVDIAKHSILEYGLDRDPAVEFSIQNGCPSTPLFVERLDEPENAYYLIPWMMSGDVIFVVEVDAVSGIMLGTITFQEPTPSPFLMPEKALDCVAQKFPQYTFGKPRLVWKPCRESTSPIRPFYEIPFEKGVLYVDMDGLIFTELTPLGYGGGSDVMKKMGA